MSEDTLVSRKAVVAFLGGISVAIQGIDADAPESRSSKRFLQVLEAALEHIGLHYPDLSRHEREDLHRLALDTKDAMKTQDFPGFENLL